MTDDQLREWKELAEKATEGGWFIVPYGDGDTYVVHSDDEQRVFFPPLAVGYSATPGSLGDPEQIKADMFFIAASRTAVPLLCEEVGKLREGVQVSAGARDVLAERARHIREEGWSAEHDDEHSSGEIAAAAGCYAMISSGLVHHVTFPQKFWPWSKQWWKPRDPRRNLVKAGALILAEIERIDRAEARALSALPDERDATPSCQPSASPAPDRPS